MFDALLQKAFADNHYSFPTRPFADYLSLLEKWNRVFNLTAINDPQKMVMLHIMDSLVVSPFLHGKRIVDVGTGAGLPGIPLALINPDKQFVLLDSNSKKIRFLTQAIIELKIPNIEIVHARCEDFHTKDFFDSIISRAFASLEVMLTSTKHLLDKNGQFLAMKGVYPHEELKSLPRGFQLLGVEDLVVTGSNVSRCLVKISFLNR